MSRSAPALFAGLLTVLFIPVSVDSFILPRALLTVLGGAVLAALGLLRPRAAPLRTLAAPAVAVALAALAALAFSVAPALSLAGEYGRYESLPVRLAYLGLFFGAARIGERRLLVTGFLVGSAVVSAEALFQWATGALAPLRPDGNLGQANLLGALMAMALTLLLDRSLRHPRWLVLGLLYLPALVASGSRSAWLAALAGGCALAVLRASRRRARTVLAGAVLSMALAVGIGLASPLRSLNQDTGSGRLGAWRDTISAIAARPLTGYGEDALGAVFGRFQSGDWSPGQAFDRAHSMPLDLAAAQGLLGLAACTWFFAVVWLALWRARPRAAGLAAACFAYLVWSLLNFDWAPATAICWLLAGAAWAATPAAAEKGGQGPRRRVRARTEPAPAARPGRPLRAGAGALIAAGLLLTVPVQAADILAYYGRPAQAAALDPLQPRYHAAGGTLAGLEAAASLQDPNPDTYLRLGDALAAAGRRQEAKAAYREALRRYPYYRAARDRLRALGG